MLRQGVFLLKGFCIGTADIIPGVSGGTMALALGIYERLLRAIRAVDGEFLKLCCTRQLRALYRRQDVSFLLPLALGIGLALFVFTRVISLPLLIQEFPERVYGVFFGLIAGSIVALWRGLPSRGVRVCAGLLLGLLAGLLVFGMAPGMTPDTPLFLFLAGALAVCAMLLPGVSGAFVLLMLGKYPLVLQAVAELRIAVLLPFVSGVCCGALLFARVLLDLLTRYYAPVLGLMIGLLLASLTVLWPYQLRSYSLIGGKQRLTGSMPVLPEVLGAEFLVVVLLMLSGFCSVLLLHRVAGRHVC